MVCLRVVGVAFNAPFHCFGRGKDTTETPCVVVASVVSQRMSAHTLPHGSLAWSREHRPLLRSPGVFRKLL